MKKKNNTPRRIRIAVAAIVFILICLAFAGLMPKATALLKIQAAPSLMKTIAAFSTGALATCIVILLVTFIFGRFYCSVVCPLGIAQDIAAFIFRRKGKPLPPHLAFPRAIALGIVIGLLVIGWTLGFKMLDPYSNFGRPFAAWNQPKPAVVEKTDEAAEEDDDDNSEENDQTDEQNASQTKPDAVEDNCPTKCLLSFYGFGAILPVIVIIGAAIWRKRLFCNAICPVGTTLGIVSRIGLFKLSITDKCIKCGRCVKACNAGCIDIDHRHLDNARCVRCMNCIAACPMGAIDFGRPIVVTKTAEQPSEQSVAETAEQPVEKQTPDLSKRELLLAVPVGLVGLGVSAAVGKHFLKALLDAKMTEATESEEEAAVAPQFILPPGAGDVARFATKCTACLLCVHNCPSKIIKPSPSGYGFVRLDLTNSKCGFDCNRCSQICPTGAIRPVPLAEKQKLRIAQAAINYKNCKVFQDNEPCGKCAEVCPTKAITLRKTGAPKMTKNLCIGCGACQAICPQKTITVSPIAQQEGVETE
jgi:ferredoxin-type protein NapF